MRSPRKGRKRVPALARLSRARPHAAPGTTGHGGRWAALSSSKEHAGKYDDQIAVQPLPPPMQAGRITLPADEKEAERIVISIFGSVD